MSERSLTLQSVIREASDRLATAHVADAAAEARRLVVEALGLDAVTLIREPEKHINSGQFASVNAWLERRSAGEPLARIRGWQEFYGRRFDLSAATLEPRADTETVIDAVLAKVDASHGRNHPWRILDVGTGSGCLAVTLLAELPQATATATDLSAHAIHTARENGHRHGVNDRITWIETNFTDRLSMDFDFVVSNPPYIKSSDIAKLQSEVRQFDPHLALDGGDSGLRCYEQLASQLCTAGWSGHLIVEIAANDADRVINAFSQHGLRFCHDKVQLLRDLTSQVRCVAIETLC